MKKVVWFFLVTLCFLVYNYEVKSADDIKPKYNIVIWNLTDAPIKNIVVTYGTETFMISRMESFTFKTRNFVDYNVPEIVIFQWKDIKGNNHQKEATMPSYKLDVDFLSSLFFRITEGNNISIAWQGYGAQEDSIDYSKIEFAVKTAASEMEALMDVNLVGKWPFQSVDKNGNDLCYEFTNAPSEKTCQAQGVTHTNIRYYKTLEDIIDIVIFLHNECDGDVSPFNRKPLFTKKADAAGQVAILIVGELEVRIIAYDNHPNVITSVKVKHNRK
jgi:hypothetical protein